LILLLKSNLNNGRTIGAIGSARDVGSAKETS
jgi:hypothetical protein